MNGSVEHLGQSNDHLRRAQNIMAWTTAIFGALLLSGMVWIANDIFHLKDQMTDTNRRFDGVEAQMSALGTRLDDLNITIEQIGAELLAARTPAAPAGPDVSVLSTPSASAQSAGLGKSTLGSYGTRCRRAASAAGRLDTGAGPDSACPAGGCCSCPRDSCRARTRPGCSIGTLPRPQHQLRRFRWYRPSLHRRQPRVIS